MNADLVLIRDFIQTYGLYLQLIALIAYVIYVRKNDAFFYSLSLVIVFSFVHYMLEKELMILGQNPQFERLVYNAWYLGFAYTDAVLVILLIYITHKKKLKIDSASRMIMISYVSLGVMQILRYLDRIILEADKLGAIYSIVVPTINISITVAACAYVVFTFLKKRDLSSHNSG